MANMLPFSKHRILTEEDAEASALATGSAVLLLINEVHADLEAQGFRAMDLHVRIIVEGSAWKADV
jgi:hypothetical protein